MSASGNESVFCPATSSRTYRVTSGLQHFGPPIARKGATLVRPAGLVSSRYRSAVSGASDRLSWPRRRQSKPARLRALSWSGIKMSGNTAVIAAGKPLRPPAIQWLVCPRRAYCVRFAKKPLAVRATLKNTSMMQIYFHCSFVNFATIYTCFSTQILRMLK